MCKIMMRFKDTVFILQLFVFSCIVYGNTMEDLNDACINNTLCENLTTEFPDGNDFDREHYRELATNIFNFPDNAKTSTTTENNLHKEPEIRVNTELSRIQKVLEERSKDRFCGCDLTTGVCNINCCCDLDCAEHHFNVFSYCTNREIDKEKDNWYCKEKPFYRRNDTRFILEKIIDSLFCVASDNLPPVYSATSHLQVEDEKSLQKVLHNNKPSQFKWRLNQKKIVSKEFNISNSYRFGDVLWKIRKSFLQPFELPQTGFGKACDFKKTIKFLEDWTSSCHQNNLNNKNSQLFPSNYSNITVIALPLKFSSQYLLQQCPENICKTLNVSLCSESWINCIPNKTVKEYCSENVCYNVAKKVRYVIHHNGSEGIKSVDLFLQLANVSNNFKQDIEVYYKWLGINQSLMFERSGNPGYIAGKPIFVGTQISNKTDETDLKYIVFNKTYEYLTLPVADKNGVCSNVERYTVKFLEDIKLKCSVTVKTNNFSTSACIKLQNRTFESIINFMMCKNFEKLNLDKQFVSKSGNVFDNNTDNWTKMFFEKVPQNVITAQIMETEIQCSGLVTSVVFNIVHSMISKPGTNKNHVILGVGVTFSQEVDLKWSKCVSKNCQDSLQLDLISFVSFHDVSRPTRYHIAGGPNLDISLPYDFFYPFLSHSKSSLSSMDYVTTLFNIGVILFTLLNLYF